MYVPKGYGFCLSSGKSLRKVASLAAFSCRSSLVCFLQAQFPNVNGECFQLFSPSMSESYISTKQGGYCWMTAYKATPVSIVRPCNAPQSLPFIAFAWSSCLRPFRVENPSLLSGQECGNLFVQQFSFQLVSSDCDQTLPLLMLLETVLGQFLSLVQPTIGRSAHRKAPWAAFLLGSPPAKDPSPTPIGQGLGLPQKANNVIPAGQGDDPGMDLALRASTSFFLCF